MPLLYKYMPLRPNFFDDPLLRLTPPTSLNDPFDSKPTTLAIEKKAAAFFDSSDSKKVKKSARDHYCQSLETGLNHYGIVSLSEDPYSLLMWSHYANEHKGMVISVLADEHTFHYHDPFTENCGISKTTPQKLLYSSRRPGFEMPDETIYEYYEHNFFSHIAFVKSDEWIYEKEYRYLIRTNEVDAAIFTATINTEISTLCSPDFSIQHIQGNQYKVQASSPEKSQTLIWWLAISQGRKLITDVMYFKRIEKDALNGVYLGCRVTDEQIYKTSELICASKNINSSTNIYRARQSAERFEINFENLGPAEFIRKPRKQKRSTGRQK